MSDAQSWLTQGLVYQAHQYFALDRPAWPDDVYDQQYATLKELEATNTPDGNCDDCGICNDGPHPNGPCFNCYCALHCGPAPYSPTQNVGCPCPVCQPKLWAEKDLQLWEERGYTFVSRKK